MEIDCFSVSPFEPLIDPLFMNKNSYQIRFPEEMREEKRTL